MARRKAKNEAVRKISKIGNFSLGITLPVSALASLGWKNKQKVVVRRVPRGLMITDFPTKKK